MRRIAWFSIAVWIVSLWLLYPLPPAEIELVERVYREIEENRELESSNTSVAVEEELSIEGVRTQIWVQWSIVTAYVLVGLFFSVVLLHKYRFGKWGVSTWSVIYLAYVLVHFSAAGYGLNLAPWGTFVWEWRGAIALNDLMSQLGFLHSYVLLPVAHVIILIGIFRVFRSAGHVE